MDDRLLVCSCLLLLLWASGPQGQPSSGEILVGETRGFLMLSVSPKNLPLPNRAAATKWGFLRVSHHIQWNFPALFRIFQTAAPDSATPLGIRRAPWRQAPRGRSASWGCAVPRRAPPTTHAGRHTSHRPARRVLSTDIAPRLHKHRYRSALNPRRLRSLAMLPQSPQTTLSQRLMITARPACHYCHQPLGLGARSDPCHSICLAHF